MARAPNGECAGDDDGAGCAHSVGRGPKARDGSTRTARRRCGDRISDDLVHWERPRCAPPPPRRTTATRGSPRAILPSRSHPLRAPDPRLETAPDARAPTCARAAIWSTRGWPPDAARGVARLSTMRSARRLTSTRCKTPSPPRNPCNDRIVRPTPLLTEGLDSRGVRRQRDPRRACSPTRSPRRLGGSRPGPSPSPTHAFYFVDAHESDDE